MAPTANTRELIERARRVAAELCARAARLEAGLERDAQATRIWTHTTPVDDAANYCNGVDGYLRGEALLAEPSDTPGQCRNCGKPIEQAAEPAAPTASEDVDGAGRCTGCGCTWHRCRAYRAGGGEAWACCRFCSHTFTDKERAAFTASVPHPPELEIVTQQPTEYPF